MGGSLMTVFDAGELIPALRSFWTSTTMKAVSG
jgi:hypothetical protein